MTPKNWPKGFIYSRESHAVDVHPLILRSMLSSSSEMTFSALIEEKRVHEDIELLLVKKKHPLFSIPTLKGHLQRGIFAKKSIDAGVDLGEYVGEIQIQSSEGKVPKKVSDYYWGVGFGNCFLMVDSNRRANELAFVNDYRGIAKKPNVHGKLIEHRGLAYFGYATLKKIKRGEELLIDYGEMFWKHPSRSQKKILTPQIV